MTGGIGILTALPTGVWGNACVMVLPSTEMDTGYPALPLRSRMAGPWAAPGRAEASPFSAGMGGTGMAPVGAVELGGTYQRPWVINNRGQRYVWNGYDWDQDFAPPRIDRRGLTRDALIRGLAIPFAVGGCPKAVITSGLTPFGDMLTVEPTGASEVIATTARGSLNWCYQPAKARR